MTKMISVDKVLQILDSVSNFEGPMPDSTYRKLLAETRDMSLKESYELCTRISCQLTVNELKKKFEEYAQ